MRTLLRLLRFLRDFGGEVLFAVFLAAATVTSSVALLGTSAWLISTAAVASSIAVLQVAVVSVRLFGLLRGLLRYAERLVSHSVNFRLVSRLRVWIYERLERLVPADTAGINLSEQLQRIQHDVDRLDQFYVRSISPVFTAILLTLGMSLWMGSLAPLLGLICAAGMAGGALLGSGWILTANRMAGREKPGLDGRLFQETLTYLRGLPEDMLFGKADLRQAQVLSMSQRVENFAIRIQRNASLGHQLTQWVGQMSVVALLSGGAGLVERGELERIWPGVLAVAFLAGYEAILGLPQTAQFLAENLAAAQKLFALADQSPAVTDPMAPQKLAGKPDLLLNDVHFSYQADGREALRGVDVEIPAGSQVALVGPNGSGKSTVAALLTRFYPAGKGVVRLAGRDVADLSLADLRRTVLFSPQPAVAFEGTLRSNLHLGNPVASAEELEAVASEMGLMAEGGGFTLDSRVGSQGTQMSGGERQRLVTATALLSEAPVLVLDEPASGLDPQTRHQVLAAIRERSAGRTLILISHDLHDLDWVERIYVLREGRISESGTFAELARSGGWFAAALQQEKGRLAEKPNSP